MTKEELFRAVGEVREDQITDAETMERQRRPWRRYGALAACFAVLLAGAFALNRLNDTAEWKAITGNFNPLTRPESAPADADSGGGEEAYWPALVMPFNPLVGGGGLDGAEYWTEAGKRPGFNYSVNVEIGELSGGVQDDVAMDGGEKREETDTAACLAWLSPEEIFARDTVIFRGTVQEVRYYEVNEVTPGGGRTQYTAAAVEVTDPIRGDLEAGEIRLLLYPGGPDMATSLSGPLERLEVGGEAIFMPERANGETGVRNGASYFCYADVAEFYLSEGARFAFLDTGKGLVFDRGTYTDIADAETLEEVADYIRRMTAPEGSRPASVPAEPQAAPEGTDPALLDPSYGVEQPNGARETDLMISG